MYALPDSLGACANGKCVWTAFTIHTPSLASGFLSPAMMEILPHQFTARCRVFHTGCRVFYRLDAPCLMELPLLGDVWALANLLFSGAAGSDGLVWTAVSSGARSTVDSIPKSGTGGSEGAGTGQVHIHCQIVLRRPFALVETPTQCMGYNP